MKINNETKIGALTVVSIALLIIGFNFLKGKSIFKSGNFLYAKYTDTKGLAASNGVFINGYQIGSVYEIEPANEAVTELIVTIKLKEAFLIPNDSKAVISSNPLGSPTIDITRGASGTSLQNEDTLLTENNPSFLGNISSKLAPVADQLTATLHSLDTVLRNVNTIFDPATKGNLQTTVSNLSSATAAMVKAGASLEAILNTQTGALAGSLKNVESFTKNLAANNETFTHTVKNIDSVTGNLARADIEGVMTQLKSATSKLDSAMTQINNPSGSIGALLYDKQIYNSLNSTVVSLHTLMDDLRVHPKRYVNISLLGKKDKGDYITTPLKQDTVIIAPVP